MKTSATQQRIEICSQYKAEINRILTNRNNPQRIGFSFGRNVSNTIYLVQAIDGKVMGRIGDFNTSKEVENTLRTILNFYNFI